ncbi:MAG: hypothetical protein JSV14_04595 [Deltaproteobacteria bacterium]|nr:MAG: hypothetical protein JSV14_04595 [Deltaproteobacteria bacterium]
MARREWQWTETQEFRAEQVKEIAEDLRAYWPLTLRQIHYQLVARLIAWSPNGTERIYRNTRSEYNMLSKLLKWMRIDGMIPWRVMVDDHRSREEMLKYETVNEFIDDELAHFLTGYRRCLIQDQPKYIEVWVEKGALRRICKDVAWEYCLPVVSCTGYQSVTYLENFAYKAHRAISKGKDPVVLYVGDLDPSGVQMFEANIETLEDEMDVVGAEFHRIALNPDQVAAYNLPSDPDAGKTTDPRYWGYVQRYGETFVELDALHPSDLQKILRTAIESHLDMEVFKAQEDEERFDDALIDELQRDIGELIETRFRRVFD